MIGAEIEPGRGAAPARTSPRWPGGAVPALAKRGALEPSTARFALGALSLSTLLSSLGSSIANVGLPALARAFGAPFGHVQWIVVSYLLAITSLIVVAGRLGDLWGRRRMLLVGIALFTVASALCGAATSLGLLIAARAAQGLGAALMMALTLALAGGTVSAERTGAALGLLGTTSAIGTALGPSLGGALIAWLGWRAPFLVQVPLGLVALWLTARHLHADSAEPEPVQSARGDRGSFDVLGTILLAAALSAYSLAMTLGRGHWGPANVALLVGAAGLVGLFVATEARVRTPLIRKEVIREPGLLGNLAMSALVSTVIMATLVVGPFYLTRALGLDPAWTGLILSVGPAVAALVGLPAGRLVDRSGAPPWILAGLLGVTAGALLLAVLPTAAGVAGYVVSIALLTAGYALFQTANNTAVMSTIGAGRKGVVSGLLNLSRHLGLVTGASLLGAVFAAGSGAPDVANAAPEAVAVGMRITFAVGAGMAALPAFALIFHRLARRSSSPALDRV